MDKKPIRLTEQDLHFLVEEAVRGYIRENGMQEGVWGGLKNVWNGMKQGNLNVGQTYKAGNWASSFNKYEQQVQKIIQQMQQVAQKSGNQQVVSDLDTVSQQFTKTAQEFSQMAQNVANTKPQFNTQVNSGFANNQQQAQGQQQQPQGGQQQTQGQQQQPQMQQKLNAMGKPIQPTNPNNGLMAGRSDESRRPRKTIR
jgi:hypothetical protein